jgi:hypothetical protein
MCNGLVFDSNETRILGLKMKADSPAEFTDVAWRLADNSWAVLTRADALAVWEAFETHLRNCFQKFAEKEAQVMAVEGSLEEVDNIVW